MSNVTFNNIGNLLISCSTDRTVRVWDIENETSIILMGHKNYVKCVLCYEDENLSRLVSCSADGNIIIWDFYNIMSKSSNDNIIKNYQPHSDRIRSVCLGHFKGKVTFFSNSDDGKILEWYIEDGEPTGRGAEINKRTSEVIDYNPITETILFDCDVSNWQPNIKCHLDQLELADDKVVNFSYETDDDDNPIYDNAISYHMNLILALPNV